MPAKIPAELQRYLDALPAPARSRLKKIRAIALAAAPDAEDLFSYRMPALRNEGRILVYYAAFKGHIGLFPPIRGNAAIERASASYRGPKGNLRLPFDVPLPEALLRRMFEFRARKARSAADSAPRQRR